MLLPDKYIPLEDTLPSLGKLLYEKLRFPLPPYQLWDKVESKREVGTYERFIYALDFLYALGLIELENGFLRRVRPC